MFLLRVCELLEQPHYIVAMPNISIKPQILLRIVDSSVSGSAQTRLWCRI